MVVTTYYFSEFFMDISIMTPCRQMLVFYSLMCHTGLWKVFLIYFILLTVSVCDIKSWRCPERGSSIKTFTPLWTKYYVRHKFTDTYIRLSFQVFFNITCTINSQCVLYYFDLHLLSKMTEHKYTHIIELWFLTKTC